MRPRARQDLRLTMRRLLNILGALVLVLLLALHRSISAAIGDLSKPVEERRRDRDLPVLLGAAVVVVATFLALAVWALVDAGYWVLAVLLAALIALLLGGARRSEE